MSVVIIGGHDRMVCQYKKICKSHKCKAKVFTQMSADLDKQIGDPDLCILYDVRWMKPKRKNLKSSVAIQVAALRWKAFCWNMQYEKIIEYE